MQKPKFDPNKPFEPVSDKPAFDPNKPFEAADAAPPQGNKLEAGLQGLGKSGTFGYLPNLQAAAEQVTFPILSKITGQNVEPDSYVQARDQYNRRDQALQKSNPGAYLAGEIAGGLITPTPGAGLIKGAGSALKATRVGNMVGAAGGAVANAAARGAVSSAIYNPGEKEGEIDVLQLGDRAKQAAIGTLVGGGMTKAGQSLVAGGQKLKQAANFLTTKAIGSMKGDFKRLLKKKELDDVAEFARESGIVKLGNNVDDVVERSQQILNDSGPKIKKIYAQTQAKVNDPKFLQSLKPEQAKQLLDTELIPEKIAKELSEELNQEWGKKAGGKQVLSRIQSELDQLQNLGPVADVEDMLKFRRSVDDLINFDKPLRDMAGGQEALVSLRRKIQQKIDDRIDSLDKIVGGSSLKELKRLNRVYKNASTIQKISESAKAGEEAKMVFGLTERQAALGGLGLGGLQAMSDGQIDENDLLMAGGVGLLTGAGSKLARRYGPGVGSSVLSKMQRPVEAVGGLLQSSRAQDVVNRVRRGNE